MNFNGMVDPGETDPNYPSFAGAALDMDISTMDYDDTVSVTDIESTAWVHENREVGIGVVAQGVTHLDTYEVEVSFDTARVEFIEGIEDNPPEGIVNLLKKNGGATVGFQAVEIANGTVDGC